MLHNKRISKVGWLLAAGAAFAYYKYSKMTPEQKANLTSSLKETGQKLYDEYVPANVKDMFGKKENTNPHNTFDEASVYNS